jgi:hypothetical protein
VDALEDLFAPAGRGRATATGFGIYDQSAANADARGEGGTGQKEATLDTRSAPVESTLARPAPSALKHGVYLAIRLGRTRLNTRLSSQDWSGNCAGTADQPE